MARVVEHSADLGITRISRWIFNCYVLHRGHTGVVVDAGLPGSPDDVANVLAVRAKPWPWSAPPTATATTWPAHRG